MPETRAQKRARVNAIRAANGKPPTWRDYARTETGAPTLGDRAASAATSDPCPPDGPVPMECGGERLTLAYHFGFPPYAV